MPFENFDLGTLSKIGSFLGYLVALPVMGFAWIMNKFGKYDKRLHEYELILLRDYMTKAEVKDEVNTIHIKLDKIIDKLDGKVDKD